MDGCSVRFALSRHAAGLALACCASLAACGSEQSALEPLRPQVLPPEGTIAVDFRTDQSQYKFGASAKTTLVNHSTSTLTMGVCDVLERAVEGGWAEVPGSANVACIALALIVAPGDSATIPLGLSLASEPGTYRARRRLYAETGSTPQSQYRRTNTFTMVR